MGNEFNNENENENSPQNSENTENVFENEMNEQRKKKNAKSGLAVLIIIAALALLLGIIQVIVTFAGKSEATPKTQTVKKSNRTMGKYVAELYIEGVIQEENETYNQEWLLETIEMLKNDNNNLGILLYIDSPGGTVYEADETYLALMDYKTEKPLWAYFGAMAASGGYYIGCAADKIAANRNALTGSIGVISGQSVDLSELMKSFGIKMTTITAGKNKNMGSVNEPLTEEQKQIMQSIADECYEQFTDIVAKSRSLSIESVKNLADGRVYTAKQALNAHLIDEISSYEEFKNAFLESFEAKSKISYSEFKYEKEKNFFEGMLGIISKQNENSVSAESKLLENVFANNLKYPAFIYNGYR